MHHNVLSITNLSEITEQSYLQLFLVADAVTIPVRMNPVKRRYCRIHKHSGVS